MLSFHFKLAFMKIMSKNSSENRDNQVDSIQISDLQVNDVIKLRGAASSRDKAYTFVVVKVGDDDPWIKCIEPVTSRVYGRSIRLVDNLQIGGRLEIDFPDSISYKTLIHRIEELELNEATISEKLASTPVFSGIKKIINDIRRSLSES